MIRRIRGIVSAIGFALGVSAAIAQTPAYPSKPIRVIVSLASGSSADIVTRIITPKLSEAFGQQFLVDNRAGAAGNIAAELAARSAPDGYTLLIVPGGITINQTLFAKLNYNLEKDFEPVGLFASVPLVLVVHPSLPVKSVKELIALAKARPRQLHYGSNGSGSTPHLTAELFKMQAGVDIIHVPYKGTPQSVTDLVGGRIAMTFAGTLSVQPHVNSGRLRALAISSAKRSASAPELPTIAESGLAGFDVNTWYGMLAPAGTSRDITTRLNRELANVIRTPDIGERLASQGVDPVAITPAEFAAYITAEIAKWGKAVKASGASVD